MSKEVMMEKAFKEIVSTGAVRFTDDQKTDFDVIKTAMVGFAKRNNIDVDVAEIEAYIKKEFATMEKIAKDFSYQKKMM
ncbi:hypothetical protein M2140_002012 [Clostridiales Family XIII bacterium PM5-7]